MKPTQVLFALQRHAGKTVIFIDVDARVLAPLNELAEIRGDVGFHIRTRYRRHGGMRFRVRSGTLVFQPTDAAMGFATHWAETAREAPWGGVDQEALTVALGRMPGVSFTVLDNRFCAVEADKCDDPVILHDSASRNVRKLKRWQRWLRRGQP
jgi:hypothetical protein